jgi:hypothetical protein
MLWGVQIIEPALVFTKGLHHWAGGSDFRRWLSGQGEADLVVQELVDLSGLV